MAQTERNDWHKSTEIGGIVYSETVALLMRRMQIYQFELQCILVLYYKKAVGRFTMRVKITQSKHSVTREKYFAYRLEAGVFGRNHPESSQSSTLCLDE